MKKANPTLENIKTKLKKGERKVELTLAKEGEFYNLGSIKAELKKDWAEVVGRNKIRNWSKRI